MPARPYARVSTSEQAEHGYSLAAQRERIADFCRSQGWAIAGWYTDDGQSAKDMDRPALQRLLADMAPGDIVVVYRLDRLTRSVLDLHTMLRLFEDRQVGFRSVTEVYDTTTAMGRLFITLVAAMAQWERENLAERVLMGMTQAARSAGNGVAKWLGGVAPYGYRLAENTLIPDPIEATVAARIFADYAAGIGIRSIARHLNDQRVPGPGGSQWYDQTVNLILKNPVYRGALSWGRRKGQGGSGKQDAGRAITVEDVFPALVPADTWRQVQRVRAGRTSIHPRSATAQHPLTGVLVCGLCGTPVTGNSQRRYDQCKRPRWTSRQYRCRQRTHNGTCTLPYMRADRLEVMVLERIRELADPERLALRVAESLANNRVPGADSEVAALADRLRRVRADTARLDRDYRSGELGARAYSRQIETMSAEEEQLVARCRELNAQRAAPADPAAEAVQYAELTRLWPDMTLAERREAIRSVLREIRVLPGPEITVQFRWQS